MEFKELKIKPEKELQKLLTDSRLQLRELRFKVASNQLKNVKEIQQVRKMIAQILMLLRQNKPQANKVTK